MKKETDYFTEKFYSGPLRIESPDWGMTFKSAGSMRFRWNETNVNRDAFLSRIAQGRQIAAVQLIHSKIVYAIDDAEEVNGLEGDGIITTNPKIMPVVTVADCMPVYIYEKNKGVFGVLHSGWKGTGIVKTAIEKAEKVYGARREDFFVVMGPHIHDCCYTVDEERAQYFRVNFTPECVTPVKENNQIIYAGNTTLGQPVAVQKENDSSRKYRLSLVKANLAVLREMGVPEGHIVAVKDCTCCNPQYGSFRRETLGLPSDMSLEEKTKLFTPQAAFIKF